MQLVGGKNDYYINQNQRQYAVGILTNSLAVQRAIQALEKADFPN